MSENIKYSKNLEKRKISGRERRKNDAMIKQKSTPLKPDGSFPFETIHGLGLKEVEYSVPKIKDRKKSRNKFKKFRRKFLMYIAETHEQDLKALGLSELELGLMREGKTPNGYNVHHKHPIHGGGKNEMANLTFTPINPHDDLHDVVMDRQIEGLEEGQSKKVLIPWTDDLVYKYPDKNFDKSKDYLSLKGEIDKKLEDENLVQKIYEKRLKQGLVWNR